MNKILICLAITLATTLSHAREIQAPFGLQWGQSKSQLEDQGVLVLTNHKNKTHAIKCRPEQQRCFTRNPPKPVSSADTYTLRFFPGKGLQIIEMRLGYESAVRHSYGTEKGNLKEAGEYTRLKDILTRKYGNPESHTGWYSVSTWNINGGGSIVLSQSEVESHRLSYDQKKIIGEVSITVTYKSAEGEVLEQTEEEEKKSKVERKKKKEYASDSESL